MMLDSFNEQPTQLDDNSTHRHSIALQYVSSLRLTLFQNVLDSRSG